MRPDLFHRLQPVPGEAVRLSAVPHWGQASASVSGFTLLELLVALAIAGTVALLAHRMFAGVADGAAHVEEARRTLDREMNARRLLVELVASLEVGTTEASGFRGERERVSFTTWTLVPEGWLARRTVTLGARDSAFVVSGLTDAPLALAQPITRVEFDYLLDPGATERWVQEWMSPVSAPVAIRVRLRHGTEDEGRVDTLLLIVGTRG
ncbi:MAG TPA: prepilin-type N-terminal cleavage/methylation domain-containing protein [Candidatus Tectomicrobia bacterium]|nr:prepilin-type N-terminal cleavage/methylation domain-containing protein [Candidatus Tectomicrobia bacterium]